MQNLRTNVIQHLPLFDVDHRAEPGKEARSERRWWWLIVWVVGSMQLILDLVVSTDSEKEHTFGA